MKIRLVVVFIFFISLKVDAVPYLEWDAYDDIGSSIKKSTVIQAKNQSVRLDTLSKQNINNLSIYELDLYTSILKLDTAKTPVFSFMSGVGYNDSISYQIFPNFFYSSKYWESELGYQIDSKFEDDSLYANGIGKRDRKVFARVYNASFMIKFYKNWKIGFNRKPLNYSYIGNQSAFLSNNPYSYDKFELKYKGKMFQFDMFSGLLSDSKGYYRRLYGKHLNFIFNVGNFVISPGAMESMIDANKSDIFRYNYLYPIMPSFLNMMNTEAGGNAFIASDLLVKYSKYINYYIQLGVDDFQIDRGSGKTGDEEPNMLTLTTELDYYPTKNIGVEIGYSKVGPWVYYVNYNLTENYQHFGKTLGSTRNNTDKVKFSAYYDYKRVRNRLDLSYNRYGWQSLNDSAYIGIYWKGYDLTTFPVSKIGDKFVIRRFDIKYSIRYSKYAKLSVGFFNKSLENEQGFSSINGFNFNISVYPQIDYQTKLDFLK